jgi:hypothetical protein
LPPVNSWLPHFDRVGRRRGRDLLPLPSGERDGVRGLGPIGEFILHPACEEGNPVLYLYNAEW